MVNRDDFSVVTIGKHTYFVVPDPLEREFADFCENHPGYKFEPTGEVGSHVAWDYKEYSSVRTSAVSDVVNYLSQFEF